MIEVMFGSRYELEEGFMEKGKRRRKVVVFVYGILGSFEYWKR